MFFPATVILDFLLCSFCFSSVIDWFSSVLGWDPLWGLDNWYQELMFLDRIFSRALGFRANPRLEVKSLVFV
jgi:hypothetical protein